MRRETDGMLATLVFVDVVPGMEDAFAAITAGRSCWTCPCRVSTALLIVGSLRLSPILMSPASTIMAPWASALCPLTVTAVCSSLRSAFSASPITRSNSSV